jgi:tRNA pseudouridine13 synthase
MVGEVRQSPSDFVVEEITKEGLIAGPALVNLDRGDGFYSLAVLSKASCALLPVISEVSRMLGAEVGFAGMKDRCAVTHQLISIGKTLPMGDISPTPLGASIRVVGRSRWAMQLGDLRGNRFTITIRGLKEPPGEDDLASFAYLPGYYGHQRFGTARPNTHKVGRLLVKNDYEGAVLEFLSKPYPQEPGEVQNARRKLQETWDLGRAITSFPPSLAFEKDVIRRLMADPHDYAGAIGALPKSLQQLFVNSYQSYLFNRALSKRWETHGLSAVHVGDFVAPLDRWGSPSRSMKVNGGNMGDLKRMVSSGRAVLMVRILGKKTLLEGTDAEAYEEILDEEGVSQDNFGSVLGMPFDGTLRFATFRPINFAKPLSEPDDLNHGKHKVTLRMDLPKGCYATILLREIMRPDDPFSAGF